MSEINYIDAKRAQAIRKEVRRLLAHDYSYGYTRVALLSLEVEYKPDDESTCIWGFVDSLCDLPDEPSYLDELQELAACAYAENRVEFQRGKIERKGYKLSDHGAANLFEHKRSEYMAESRSPESVLDWVDIFIGAARGRISRPFSFNPTRR